MASLTYLWRNRSRIKVDNRSILKRWAKRIISLPEVIKRDYRRRKLVTKGAKIDGRAEIGKANLIGEIRNLTIGPNSFIGRVEIALHEKVFIGANVCINDGVILLTASHDIKDPSWLTIKKPIIIEDRAWIAVNAIILPGVRIGEGAVVGAGAVVSRDVEAFSIVVGNPAQSIGKKRNEQLNYNPCEFLAGNRAWLYS